MDDLGHLLKQTFDDDVDTVGGLLAERLGKVPISGSFITVDGYELVAESVGWRRNRITSVVVIPDEAIGARVVSVDESAITTKDQA